MLININAIKLFSFLLRLFQEENCDIGRLGTTSAMDLYRMERHQLQLLCILCYSRRLTESSPLCMQPASTVNSHRYTRWISNAHFLTRKSRKEDLDVFNSSSGLAWRKSNFVMLFMVIDFSMGKCTLACILVFGLKISLTLSSRCITIYTS